MKVKRFISGLFLIVILYLLCINYSINENYYINSTTNELLYNYPENQIFLSGTVTSVYNNGFKVSNYGTIYKVNGLSNITVGDTAYILGTLNSPYNVTSIKVITNNRIDFYFVIIRSIFGMIFFLVFFFNYWKFNFKKMIFIRRK
jgi:hypothetical protein